MVEFECKQSDIDKRMSYLLVTCPKLLVLIEVGGPQQMRNFHKNEFTGDHTIN